MMVWKMIFLFNWVIFRFHVILPGCISPSYRTPCGGWLQYQYIFSCSSLKTKKTRSTFFGSMAFLIGIFWLLYIYIIYIYICIFLFCFNFFQATRCNKFQYLATPGDMGPVTVLHHIIRHDDGKCLALLAKRKHAIFKGMGAKDAQYGCFRKWWYPQNTSK